MEINPEIYVFIFLFFICGGLFNYSDNINEYFIGYFFIFFLIYIAFKKILYNKYKK